MTINDKINGKINGIACKLLNLKISNGILMPSNVGPHWRTFEVSFRAESRKLNKAGCTVDWEIPLVTYCDSALGLALGGRTEHRNRNVGILKRVGQLQACNMHFIMKILIAVVIGQWGRPLVCVCTILIIDSPYVCTSIQCRPGDRREDLFGRKSLFPQMTSWAIWKARTRRFI